MKVNELWTIIRYKIGWAAIILLTSIPSIWTFRLVNKLAMPGVFGFFNMLGLVTGVAGLMLYALNLILATRLRIMEDYFGGLNRMYIAHHLTGGIALILLSFHPVLLALRYFTSLEISAFHTAAKFLWVHPISFATPITGDMAINFGIVAMFGMVVLLILTFFIHLPYKLWLFTHKFLGAAFFFAGLHVLFIKGTISSVGYLRWYLLIFSAVGLVAAAYRTLGGRILVRHYDYRVEHSTTVAKDVIELILSPINKRIDFKPGQFVFIRFKYSGVKGVTTEAHPFSISSAPTDEKLRLSVKALGDYTRDLLQLKPGAIAEIEGAYGKFSYRNYQNTNQIWVAGGIGITPFISMARNLHVEKPMQIDLYYSVKTETELVNYQELSTIMSTSAHHFRIIPYIADKQQGFLTADFIAKNSNGVAEKDIYICGPPTMMKSLRKQFIMLRVPNYRIHSEEFAMS